MFIWKAYSISTKSEYCRATVCTEKISMNYLETVSQIGYRINKDLRISALNVKQMCACTCVCACVSTCMFVCACVLCACAYV